MVSTAVPGHEFFQLAAVGQDTQQQANVGKAQHRVTAELIVNELNRLLHRVHRRQAGKRALARGSSAA